MKRGIMVLVMLALVGIGVQAQDETDTPKAWRLKTPTAEDYVQNAGEIIAAADTTYIANFYEDVSYNAEMTAMMDEIDWRLVKDGAITYDQLHSIYQGYAAREKERSYQPLTDYQWALELLKLWLNENPTDLSKTDELQFGEYSAQVMPLSSSFIGNSRIWVYLFRIVETFNVVRYVGVQAEDGSITFPELPASIDGNLLMWGRINDDEFPDIAYLHSTHMGNSYSAGTLIIASLRGDHFEKLSGLGYRQGPTDENYDWKFIQLNGKDDVEILQNQRLHDNWGCSFVEVTLFEWNKEGKLTATSQESLLPQSFECLLVQAEEAMWKHEYADAIPFYEKAFDVQPTHIDVLPFAKIRVGLAYLLTGQDSQAEAIFTALIPSDHLYAQAIQQAYENDPRPLAVCQAMYDFVAQNPYPDMLTTTGTWRSYDGGFYGVGSGDEGFDLIGASCDLSAVLDNVLAGMDFNTSESPVEQLEAVGLEVGDSIAEDFDQDGKQEWLVWPSSIGFNPLFFYPDGSVYRVSRRLKYADTVCCTSSLRMPSTYNRYSVVTLPDGLGKGLVNADFSQDEYEIIQCAGMCGGGGWYSYCAETDASLPVSPGDLTLWRVEHGELVNFLRTPLCKLTPVEQLFPDIEGSKRLMAAADHVTDPTVGGSEVISAIYVWDSASKTYLQSPQPTPIPTGIFMSTATPTSQKVETFLPNDISLAQVRKAFNGRDYARVMVIADSALVQPANQPLLIPAFQYYRALTLEALGRDDEALKAYVAIYEGAPESAWGMLARLHLEPLP